MGNKNTSLPQSDEDEDELASSQSVNQQSALTVAGLKELLNFNDFKIFVSQSLLVADLREILLPHVSHLPTREVKASLIEKVMTLAKDLMVDAVKTDKTNTLFLLFKRVAKISSGKKVGPFYKFPTSASLQQSKKRKRLSVEGSSPVIQKRSKIEEDVEVPLNLDLSNCEDPFLQLDDTHILKTFYMKPSAESTTAKINIPGLEQNEKVCIRAYCYKENDYKPSWPTNCHFHVNENNVMIRNNGVFVEDLTKFIISGNNDLQVCHDIYYEPQMKVYTLDEMKEEIPFRNYDDSLEFKTCSVLTNLVISCFKSGSGIELEETQKNVSIIDVVSQSLIKTPCRSVRCKHAAVFDIDVFLKLNLNIPHWKCPICNIPAPYNELIECGYFKRILEKHREDNSPLFEVSIHPDGSWAFDEVKSQSEFQYDNVIVISDDET